MNENFEKSDFPSFLQRKARCMTGLMIALCAASLAHAKPSVTVPCTEIQMNWAVGEPRIPMFNTKFGIVDAQRKVLYRGTTDDKGVARYCLAHIPKGAGIVIDPDTYNDEPTPLPVGANR
jgi:hypothetical protein